MKNLILFVLVIILVITSKSVVTAQVFDVNYEVLDSAKLLAYYKMISKPDSTQTSKYKSTKLLLIGDSISEFIDNGHFCTDTIMRNFKDFSQLEEYTSNPNKPIPSSSFKVYKYHLRGRISFTEYLMPNHFMYEEKISDFNWQLFTDTLTINGYLCQKAECFYGGREWTAWFCPKLPISDGPYKFCGLPGLIIKISDRKNDYSFTLESLATCAKKIAIDRTEEVYVKTSRRDFLKAQFSLIQNFDDVMKDRVVSQNPTTVKRKIASRNNPIELDRNK